MECVGEDGTFQTDAVELRNRIDRHEVTANRYDFRAGTLGVTGRSLKITYRPCILIDRENRSARSNKLCECTGEETFAGSEICPYASVGGNRRAD